MSHEIYPNTTKKRLSNQMAVPGTDTMTEFMQYFNHFLHILYIFTYLYFT